MSARRRKTKTPSALAVALALVGAFPWTLPAAAQKAPTAPASPAKPASPVTGAPEAGSQEAPGAKPQKGNDVPKNTPDSSAQGSEAAGAQGAGLKMPREPSTAEVLESQNAKFQSLESLARVLGLLETMYVEESAVQSDALIEKALKGMVSSLDPHTIYLPASQLRDLTNDTSGKFGGIGVILSQQGTRLEVVEVITDSPAARAGVMAGDVIHAVDGLVVTQGSMEEVLNRMRGLPGSSLQLELVAPSDAAKWAPAEPKPPRTRKVTLTREVIRTSSVAHQRLAPGYAYVRVSVFQEDTSEQVDKAMRLYESENGGKLDGMILDLRGNPGGLLDQAVRVADLFLDSGIIVSTIGRDRAKQEVEYATKRNTHPYMPLVVLINEGSASASEIVAGSLQDHNRALLVGTVSFGKGSVQSIVQLPNGAGLKMTIARYYTPKGRSIQAKGITPDIPIPLAPAADAAKKQQKGERAPRKEADLEGHIEASDLDAASKKEGFAQELEKWPEAMRADNQLRIGYTYLRSWSRFSNSGGFPQSSLTNPGLLPKPVSGRDVPKALLKE